MSPGTSEDIVVITRAPPRPTFSAIVRSSWSTVPSVPSRRSTKLTKMSRRVTRRRSAAWGWAAPGPAGPTAGMPAVGWVSSALGGRRRQLGVAKRLGHRRRVVEASGPVLVQGAAQHRHRGQRDTAPPPARRTATGSWMCLNSVATGVSPRKGTWPVNIS